MSTQLDTYFHHILRVASALDGIAREGVFCPFIFFPDV